MSYKPDNYHQTDPPCELKKDVMGRQGSKKGQKESTPSGEGSDASTCSLSEDPDWGELKLALNEAIWAKAPSTTTLEQAEHAACLAIGYLNKCFEAKSMSIHLEP